MSFNGGNIYLFMLIDVLNPIVCFISNLEKHAFDAKVGSHSKKDCIDKRALLQYLAREVPID